VAPRRRPICFDVWCDALQSAADAFHTARTRCGPAVAPKEVVVLESWLRAETKFVARMTYWKQVGPPPPAAISAYLRRRVREIRPVVDVYQSGSGARPDVFEVWCNNLNTRFTVAVAGDDTTATPSLRRSRKRSPDLSSSLRGAIPSGVPSRLPRAIRSSWRWLVRKLQSVTACQRPHAPRRRTPAPVSRGSGRLSRRCRCGLNAY